MCVILDLIGGVLGWILGLSLRSNFPVCGLGWGAVSLFHLFACMLHVGSYVCDDIAMINSMCGLIRLFLFRFFRRCIVFLATGCLFFETVSVGTQVISLTMFQ